MRNNKLWRINIRVSETILRKFLAIMAVNGKNRTNIIEDLISAEYDRNKKYETQYYSDLNKNIADL